VCCIFSSLDVPFHSDLGGVTFDTNVTRLALVARAETRRLDMSVMKAECLRVLIPITANNRRAAVLLLLKPVYRPVVPKRQQEVKVWTRLLVSRQVLHFNFLHCFFFFFKILFIPFLNGQFGKDKSHIYIFFELLIVHSYTFYFLTFSNKK
jgi:hypothetical protein